QVWLSDENVVVREKLRQSTTTRLTPLLATIVRQGKDEGVFSPSSAEQAAEVLVALILGLNEAATRLFLARRARTVSFEHVQGAIAAYSEAFERILGLPAGSWPTLDAATLHYWFA